MTFMVSHQGTLFQKDLGPRTAQAAEQIAVFDPDKSWTRVEGDALRLNR
jgi:hypothetical protein